MDGARPVARRWSADLFVLGGALVVAVVVFLAHIRAYFFLLDDFVIVGEDSTRGVATLLERPLFNFYRPVEHLWIKLLYGIFGWSQPSGYIACSLAVHGGCSVLVYVLARQCGLTRRGAATAATLFLLSPWATEPYFWVSGGFDLLSTAGLLAALTLGLAVAQFAPTPWLPPSASVEASADRRSPGEGWSGGRTTMAILGCLCTTVAMLAKETGVLAPLLFVLFVIGVCGAWMAVRPRAIAYTAALAIVAALYLKLRETLLPGLAGGYGDLRSLLARGGVATHAWSYARAMILLPLPDDYRLGPASVASILRALFAIAAVTAAWRAFRTRPRFAVICGMAATVSIAPVLWVGLIEGSSAGNRFLYLAGAFVSLLLAAGMEPLRTRLRVVVLVLLVGVSAASVLYQARVWREASRISRATIEQARAYAGTAQPLFISNLPAAFGMGPYVINRLAFQYYLGGGMPPVRARSMGLSFDDGEAAFAFWFDDERPAGDERVVALQLPIWMKEPRPAGRLEAPSPNAVVSQPFSIRGWAIDAAARHGTGIESVHAYAYPIGGSESDAAPLGKARYGETRPDVARTFGDRFAPSGFTLDASGLSPGRYHLVVHTRSAVSGRSESPMTMEITVR